MATGGEESKLLKEIDENFLICSICSERFKNAKVLPCLHTFCEQCLSDLVDKTGKLDCPLCRRSHELPGGGVAKLSSMSFVNELVELFDRRDAQYVEAVSCGGCTANESTKHCVECRFDLCDTCAEVHGRLPCSSSHRVIGLAEYKSKQSEDPASVQPPVHCKKHPKHSVTYYCDTCDQPICLECTILDHPRPEHVCRYLDDAASAYSKDLRETIVRLKAKKHEATASKASIQKVLDALDDRLPRETEKLRSHADRIVAEVTQVIRENEEKLYCDLLKECGERKANLDGQLKDLTSKESDLENAQEFADRLMQYGSAAQLMSAKKEMSSQIQELLGIDTTIAPAEDSCIEFRGFDDFCDSKILGEILTGGVYVLGDVPKSARVGDDVCVTVTPQEEGKERVPVEKVEATICKPDSQTDNMQITVKGGGSFTLKTKVESEGEHELSVKVGRKAVHGSPAKMKVFPKKGLLSKFGSQGSGRDQLREQHGVIQTKKGHLLVCDKGNKRLQSFTVNGDHNRAIPVAGDSGDSYSPCHITESVEGDILFTDRSKQKVVVCNANESLKPIRSFGSNELQGPHGIAASPVNGRVYVADISSHCVRIYSQDGKYVKSFGSHGSGSGQLYHPWGLCINTKGKVLVAEKHNHRVQVFNEDGEHLYCFGSQGKADGLFTQPSGVTADSADNVYVCEFGGSRVQKFDSQGNFICRIDSAASKAESPIGVCVIDGDPLGKVIVAEYNGCVKVFAQ